MDVRSKGLDDLFLKRYITPYKVVTFDQETANEMMLDFQGQIIRTPDRVYLLIEQGRFVALKIEGDES